MSFGGGGEGVQRELPFPAHTAVSLPSPSPLVEAELPSAGFSIPCSRDSAHRNSQEMHRKERGGPVALGPLESLSANPRGFCIQQESFIVIKPRASLFWFQGTRRDL